MKQLGAHWMDGFDEGLYRRILLLSINIIEFLLKPGKNNYWVCYVYVRETILVTPDGFF
jgi:hypothetical protein